MTFKESSVVLTYIHVVESDAVELQGGTAEKDVPLFETVFFHFSANGDYAPRMLCINRVTAKELLYPYNGQTMVSIPKIFRSRKRDRVREFELGEGGAALDPQLLRPIKQLRNSPLLRQRRQEDFKFLYHAARDVLESTPPCACSISR